MRHWLCWEGKKGKDPESGNLLSAANSGKSFVRKERGMKKRLFVLGLILALLCVCLPACRENPNLSPQPTETNPPAEFTFTPTPLAPLSAVDDFGREMNLTIEPARIISLAPSATELVYALGSFDQLVAVTTADDFPSQVASKEKVGGLDNPSLEKILSLEPDLVIAVFGTPMTLIENLRKQQVPVFGLNPRTVKEVLQDIYSLGSLLGKEEPAKQLIDQTLSAIATLQERVSTTATLPKVYLETWPQEPYYTFGPGSFGDDLIRIAGGENLGASADEAYPALSTDYILFENPDAIVLAYAVSGNPLEQVKARPGWQTVSAVLQNRILVPADPNIYLRPGPRIPQALDELAHFLHPDWF
jgi:iron complex transport system substrate-binding protein